MQGMQEVQGVQGVQGMQGWGCQQARVMERAYLGITTVGFVCFGLKQPQHFIEVLMTFLSLGLWQKDSPQYQALSVPEHSRPGTVVGNVTGAVDADEGSNAIVYYFIAGGDGSSVSLPTLPSPRISILSLLLPCPAQWASWHFGGGLTGDAFLHPAGNQENNFQLSREGKLKVLRDLDREKEPYHSIIVKASSQRNWAPPRGQRATTAQFWDLSEDLTLQEVRIFLDDINDQAPQFTKSEYTAGKRCQGLGGHLEPQITQENPAG